MALTNYLYSIEDDFIINHKVDITILQTEIIASTIIIELHHIDADIDGDECEVWFNDVLSTEDESELDSIIAAHTGELSGGIDPGSVGDGGGNGDIIFTFGDKYKDYHIDFSKSTYTIGTQFIFNGTNVVGTPYGVKIIVKGRGGLRLVRKDTCEIIFEWPVIKQLSGDYELHSELINNWPTDECILEFQGKKNSATLYVTCLMICFSDVNMTTNLPPIDPNPNDDDD